MGSVSVGGVANDGHFQNVSFCLCVCFSSECGGRRTWGRIEKDEKVENGLTLETKWFKKKFWKNMEKGVVDT